MKLEKLRSTLDQLNKGELILVLFYTRVRWLRHRVGALRPIHMLFPAVFAQIVLLAYTALFSDHILTTFAVGNFTIVAIVLLPSTIPHRGERVHWVK